MPAPREPNTVQPWDRPCLHVGLAWNHAMMTKDGLIFEANSLKQGRLQALTRQQLQAQATQNRERRWVALDRWKIAKQAALTKYGENRRRLYEALGSAGLGVDYAAVVGWFNG